MHPRTQIDHIKQNRILWFSAFALTFLAGYLHTVTSPQYPVSGTFGIEGRRVSYRFERVANIKDTLAVNLRSDVPGLAARLIVRHKHEGADTVAFRSLYEGRVLRAEIPVKNLPSRVLYSVEVIHRNKVIKVPDGTPELITLCLPKVPASIMSVYFLTLFGGLVLGIRCGLEYFFTGRLIKKLALFTLLSFSVNALLFVPVKTLFESGMINKRILSPTEMFSAVPLLMMLLWTVGAILLFRHEKTKKLVAASLALLTLIMFFFL